MKITDVAAIYVRSELGRELCGSCQDALIVRVHTDAEITDLAEAGSSPFGAKGAIDGPCSHVPGRTSTSGHKRSDLRARRRACAGRPRSDLHRGYLRLRRSYFNSTLT